MRKLFALLSLLLIADSLSGARQALDDFDPEV